MASAKAVILGLLYPCELLKCILQIIPFLLARKDKLGLWTPFYVSESRPGALFTKLNYAFDVSFVIFQLQNTLNFM